MYDWQTNQRLVRVMQERGDYQIHTSARSINLAGEGTPVKAKAEGADKCAPVILQVWFKMRECDAPEKEFLSNVAVLAATPRTPKDG